jgi:hypothetical protein
MKGNHPNPHLSEQPSFSEETQMHAFKVMFRWEGVGVLLLKEMKCVRVVSCGVNVVCVALTETRYI